MDALIWKGGQELSFEQAGPPTAGDGEVVVDVVAAGICGSDLHGYRGHPGPRVPPLVLGHEAVVQVPSEPGRYAVFPLATCGRCDACARGEEQLCAERGLLGLDRPGVFAGQVSVPTASLLGLPEALGTEKAVLAEPLAVGVSAVRLDAIRSGMRVLVVGAGPIGLLYAAAAREVGAAVTLADPLGTRGEIAQGYGFDVLADAGSAAPQSFDAATDTVGIEATGAAAVSAVRPGATVSIIGLGAATANVAIGDLVRRGLSLRGHYAYTRQDFDAATRLLERLELPDGWTTDYALADGARAFEDLVERPEQVTKAILWTEGR